ncbi:MAG TPA: hypothetical protein VLJ20_01710 [Acetobacteraceae bacterium]|nr:hypothetical protein [Acetobacteraceae bacterium]
MHILIAIGLLRVRVLARIGLTRPPARFVYRWVTDAETGKLFCIWLPADAARTPLPGGETGPGHDGERASRH